VKDNSTNSRDGGLRKRRLDKVEKKYKATFNIVTRTLEEKTKATA